jgi:polyisoprenyl-phosphate glycosyltransferase
MISIVVPVYNSSQFIHLLIKEIDKERIKNNWELELILVEDGSKDNSFETIKDLSKNYNYLKIIKLSRNFGHQIAVKTGLAHAKGDYIAVIDDDMQDPPNLLASFFKHLDEGMDVVYGVRKKRKESLLKRIGYLSFYRLLQKLSNIDIPLDTGDFCVMKRKVVDQMLLLQEKNPFLRGIRAWVGFRQIGVEYERNSRVAGDSGYNLKKLFKIAFDGIFAFSNLPLKLISTSGIIGLLSAISYSLRVLYAYYKYNIDVKGFTSLVILISFFSSLILICLGIIGEYIARIYDEVRNRPYSVIETKINL